MEQFREIPVGGFNFLNCARNEHILMHGFKPPQPIKTGTTTAAIIFKDGVILGADTRATGGKTIATKNCLKIHRLTKSVYCCGAGMAGDADKITDILEANLELHRLYTRRDVPTVAACRIIKQQLYRYKGKIAAAFLLGGVDRDGPQIYSIQPMGSTDKLPYTTQGSGSLAAMSVFEARWRPNMTEKDGKQLVAEAIISGIFNDLGSGSNVDLCIIRKNGAEFHRNYEVVASMGNRILDYIVKLGRTPFLKTTIQQFVVEEEICEVPSKIN